LSARSPEKDIVAREGEWIQVGGTRVKCVESPGHTTGVLSLEFPVRDGHHEYTAFTLGGAGLNFMGVPQSESYVATMKRIQTFNHIEVSLPNHAVMGQMFERAKRLKKRTEEQLHPFVDLKGFHSWISGLLTQGEEKLAVERAGISADPLQELLK
jgi:metallo-beta-lactamase class B